MENFKTIFFFFLFSVVPWTTWTNRASAQSELILSSTEQDDYNTHYEEIRLEEGADWLRHEVKYISLYAGQKLIILVHNPNHFWHLPVRDIGDQYPDNSADRQVFNEQGLYSSFESPVWFIFSWYQWYQDIEKNVDGDPMVYYFTAPKVAGEMALSFYHYEIDYTTRIGNPYWRSVLLRPWFDITVKPLPMPLFDDFKSKNAWL